MNELQAASENPEWKLEEVLKKHWPSAVEGDFELPEKGTIHYWAGEQRGRIVVRFTYPQQPAEEYCQLRGRRESTWGSHRPSVCLGQLHHLL